MDIEQSFAELIKNNYSSFSNSQKKIAQYLLENSEKASYQTIIQIARETSLSETTIIRFAYAIGFSGFSQMQKALQHELLRSRNQESFGETASTDSGSDLNSLIDNEIASLVQMKASIDERMVDEAVKMILSADNLFLIGFRSSFGVIKWFYDVVTTVRGNVTHVSSSYDGYHALLNATENSLVLAVCYSRYAVETLSFISQAKKRGSKVVVLTDSMVSPPAQMADIVFVTKPNKKTAGFNSIVSSGCLLNILISKAVESSKDSHSRLQLLEEMYGDNNLIKE